MDKLFIRQWRVCAFIGLLPSELEHRQDILIDVEVSIDAGKIAETDDIEQALDYAQMRELMGQFIEAHRFKLIETLADQLAAFLIKTYRMKWLRLSITKPAVFADAEGAGVVVERCK